MFDWFDRSANVGSHKLRSDSVNHSLLFDDRVIDKKIDIRLRQVDSCCARAENEYFGLRVDFLNDCFDAVNNFLSSFLFLLTLRNKLDEIKNLAVEEQENVLDFKSAFADPGILALVEFLGDPCLKLTAVLVSSLFLLRGLSRANESVLRHRVKAEEVLIKLVSHGRLRLGFLLPPVLLLVLLVARFRIRVLGVVLLLLDITVGLHIALGDFPHFLVLLVQLFDLTFLHFYI